ncbi:MAG: peptidoglycan DD-metalloendopeptidase family protein [bacterium]|nr:peptidoglycan DD-metalloendopeptidase family protein [bacterium]
MLKGPVAKLSPTAKRDLWPATSSIIERKSSTYHIGYACFFLSRFPRLGSNLSFLVTEVVSQQARKGLALLILLFSISGLSSAQEISVDPKNEQLIELNKQIEAQSGKLDVVYKDQSIIKKDLDTLNQQMVAIRLEENRLRSQLDILFSDWLVTNDKIAKLEQEKEKLKTKSLLRLKALYFTKRHQTESYISKISLREELPKLGYLLSKIEKFDRELFSKITVLHAAQKLEEEKYEKMIKGQKILKDKIIDKATQLNLKIRTTESLARKQIQKQREIEGLLTKLRAHALRLETVVNSITESGGAIRLNSNVSSRSKDFGSKNKVTTPAMKDFFGPGLIRGKRVLARPVVGKVLRKFGKFKHAEFKDFVLNKGLIFETEPGSEVRVITAGRVIYFGRLPGYGTMLIIDHGKRCYSLYARLDTVNVKLHQILAEGEQIGLTGTSGSDKGNFYFEIRVNGKPVDPLLYYSKL